MKLGSIGLAVGLGMAAVSLSAPAQAAAVNLVTNGDFETGDLTGWTSSAGSIGSVGVNGTGGSFGFVDGAIGSVDTLSQTLATTPGQGYSLSFYLENVGGGSTTLFQALVDGTPLVSLNDSPSFSFTPFTFNFVAASPSTNLAFNFRHDPVFWSLDDVSVTAATAVPFEFSPSLGFAVLGAGYGVSRLRKSRKQVTLDLPTAASADKETVSVG